MKITKLNESATGMIFYNQIQILEHLAITMISNFCKVSIIETNDMLTEIECDVEGNLKRVIFTYLPGVLIMDSSTTLTLYIKNYIRPFGKKYFAINKKNFFSELLYEEKLKNLYACIKNQFIRTPPTVFSNLTKFLFADIVSFLDKCS